MTIPEMTFTTTVNTKQIRKLEKIHFIFSLIIFIFLK